LEEDIVAQWARALSGGGGGCVGNGRLAPAGSYRVSLSVGGREVGTQLVRVLDDAWLNER
jgi:hypothetical protein